MLVSLLAFVFVFVLFLFGLYYAADTLIGCSKSCSDLIGSDSFAVILLVCCLPGRIVLRLMWSPTAATCHLWLTAAPLYLPSPCTLTLTIHTHTDLAHTHTHHAHSPCTLTLTFHTPTLTLHPHPPHPPTHTHHHPHNQPNRNYRACHYYH